MNDHIDRDNTIDSTASIQPEMTPFLLGPGVVIKGDVICEHEDPQMRMMIVGRLEGDIKTKGIVQIAKGAVVAAKSMIDAGVVIVSGSIIGENVTVRAGVLVLQSTGNIEVKEVCLPPGGFEQQRGGILNARLVMAPVTAAVTTTQFAPELATAE